MTQPQINFMTLRQYVNQIAKRNPVQAMRLAEKMIDLEMIERYINLVFGVELDVRVKPAKPIKGRFYGKGIMDELLKLQKKT